MSMCATVEEWVYTHMGSHIESWVEDFLQYDPEGVLSDDLMNLQYWDVEGVAEHLEAILSDLASTHRLRLEDEPISVFGNEAQHFGDLYATLLEKYYAVPEFMNCR